MRELEARLRDARDDVAWPETPDLVAAVAARIEGVPRRATARRSRRPRLALAVALGLLVPAAAAIAFPSARDDVLDWLGIRGAEVRRVEQPPRATDPRPNDLGRLVSTEQAGRLAGFRPSLPAELGSPRELRYDDPSGFVSALYADGVLVAQARGALSRPLLAKIVGPGTGVRPVTVDGAIGVYIDGPHAYLYERPDGMVEEDRPRRTPRALVFNRGDLLVRIEGPPLGEALEIARSLP